MPVTGMRKTAGRGQDFRREPRVPFRNTEFGKLKSLPRDSQRRSLPILCWDLLKFWGPQDSLGWKGPVVLGASNQGDREQSTKQHFVSGKDQHSMFLETKAHELECLQLITRRRGVPQLGKQLLVSFQHAALDPMKKSPFIPMPLEWKPDLKASTGLPAGCCSDICRQSGASSCLWSCSRLASC